MHSCHVGFSPYDNIIARIADMEQIAAATGIRVFISSAMFSNSEDCKRHTEQFSEAADRMKTFGLQLLYHNHSEEFTYSEEIHMTCMDYFLQNCSSNLNMQVDVGWVMFAGANVINFMDRYKTKIRSIHLKDFKKGFCPENRVHDIVAVGTGALPLDDILKSASKMDLADTSIIIDQDCSPKNILTDLKTGYKNVEAVINR